MDFFRNQWVPARSVRPEFQYKTPERRSPRVVQIPVHFVRSETTLSASALKIQKVFRGFLVRRSVKKIVAIKREVGAIEARVSRREVADLIKKDEKERLKVNESLMSLLLKLDAVSGGAVDSGIRVCRKAVIRKAILLQEKVDSLCSDQIPETCGEIDAVGLVENGDDKKEEMIEGPEQKAFTSEETQSASISSDNMEDQDGDRDSEVKGDERSCSTDCIMEEMEANEDPSISESVVEDMPEQEANGSNDDDKIKKTEVNEEKNCAQAQDMIECEMDYDDEEDNEVEIEEGIDRAVSDRGVDAKDNQKNIEDDGTDDKKNSKGLNELMERMMEENGKMMKMMSEMFERSEAQARTLNTLTLRLEQLEKAFLCNKLGRKKKKNCC